MKTLLKILPCLLLFGCATGTFTLPAPAVKQAPTPQIAMAKANVQTQTYTILGNVTAVPGATNYAVYVGTSSRSYFSRVDLAGATSFQVAGCQYKTLYYLAGTCTDDQGRESDYGTEVRWSMQKPTTAAAAAVP